jgi:hypothetical protein
MKVFWRLVVLVFILYLPYVVVSDLMHPEIWDSDSLHDPRKYGWLCLGVTVLGLVLLWRGIRLNRRLNDMVRRAKDGPRS